MTKINVNDGADPLTGDNGAETAITDLLYIYHSKAYLNEKGYLQKLVELLYNLGYYKDNKSLFLNYK